MKELPPGWAKSTLADLGVKAQPGFASGANNRIGTGVVHLRPMNVSRSGRLDLRDVKYVEDDSDRRVFHGDVLFNNTNSPDLVGKAALVTAPVPLAYSNHMTRLRPGQALDGSFLAHQLQFLWAGGYFQRICSNHVNQASVASQRLLETEVAVPPLPEQRRIVDALEAHLSRLEAGIAGTNSAGERARRLMHAVATRAVCGSVSTNNHGATRNVATDVSVLAQRSPLTPLVRAPAGWRVATIGELAMQIEYGSSAKAGPRARADDVPIVRMGNIQNGEIIWDKLKYLPSGHPDTSRLRLHDGDLLFNRTNSAELVGKCAVYRSPSTPATFASYLIRCRFGSDVVPE